MVRERPQLVLQATGLTRPFSGHVVLNDIDFEALSGEISGLVGENGAGKSTLINLLTGALPPDAGMIVVGGEAVAHLSPHAAEARGIAAAHGELRLCPHLAVVVNIYLGQVPTTTLGRLDNLEIVAGTKEAFASLGVAIDSNAIAGELSLADQQLVEIAKALVSRPKLLILDEATSTLGSGQVALLFAALRQLRDAGTATVFVSHRLDEVFAITDGITVLKNGAFVATVPAAGSALTLLIAALVGVVNGLGGWCSGCRRS